MFFVNYLNRKAPEFLVDVAILQVFYGGLKGLPGVLNFYLALLLFLEN